MGIQRHSERGETTSGYSTRSLWLLIMNDALVSCMRLIGPLNSDWSQKKRSRTPSITSSSVARNRPIACRLDGDQVFLTIELTTPACPMKETIQRDVEAALRNAGASSVSLEFTANTRGPAGPRRSNR